jgi:Trk K+ transport system NAD-binding subunit
MRGHTIVCGHDALAIRIIDELNNAEMSVVRLRTPADLRAADIGNAHAVICASEDDAINLEIALLARRANPKVRVVSRLANTVLRQAMTEDNGPGAVLDVADLAAPSVVEACLDRTTHTIVVAGVEFVISGATAPRDGTLRQIYGDLAPVAIVRAEHGDTQGEMVACPGRDITVQRGDWTVVIGTGAELARHGIQIAEPITGSRKPSRLGHFMDALRAFRDDLNPLFYRALTASAALLVGSTLLLRLYYKQPGMSWVDALYFSAETIATVGYGDFNFANQDTWLRLWSIAMMLAGVGTTAIVVAFVADGLLSRRLSQSTGRQRVRHLNRHIVVVGLGSFGIRVAGILKAAGHDVAVIERAEDNRYTSMAAALDIPVIFGDATLRQTLEAARVDQARAVAVLTQDDMVNIETGIVLRELLNHNSSAPIVLRIYDRALGSAVGHRFGFEYVRSTVDLAAPWFIGAAMGLDVLGTFSVGQRSFMIGGVKVRPGSELDGISMSELSTQTRVIAIERDNEPIQLHPRRDSRLTAGDTAYLVGPYRELLTSLRKGQPATAGA